MSLVVDTLDEAGRSDREDGSIRGSSGVSALWELNIFVRIIPNVMNN